jgi:hypothetical protein
LDLAFADLNLLEFGKWLGTHFKTSGENKFHFCKTFAVSSVVGGEEADGDVA